MHNARGRHILTFEGICSGIVEEPLGDLLDVIWQRVSGAAVDGEERNLL